MIDVDIKQKKRSAVPVSAIRHALDWVGMPFKADRLTIKSEIVPINTVFLVETPVETWASGIRGRSTKFEGVGGVALRNDSKHKFFTIIASPRWRRLRFPVVSTDAYNGLDRGYLPVEIRSIHENVLYTVAHESFHLRQHWELDPIISETEADGYAIDILDRYRRNGSPVIV